MVSTVYRKESHIRKVAEFKRNLWERRADYHESSMTKDFKAENFRHCSTTGKMYYLRCPSHLSEQKQWALASWLFSNYSRRRGGEYHPTSTLGLLSFAKADSSDLPYFSTANCITENNCFNFWKYSVKMFECRGNSWKSRYSYTWTYDHNIN